MQQEYDGVFAEPSGLPPGGGVEHVIPLPNPLPQPPFQCMYRLAPTELQELQRQVTDMLARQLIEPSTGPCGAPNLFVEKKTGFLRVGVDYRALNKVTIKNCYLLPCVDYLLGKPFGARCFSCLDAASVLPQILLRDEDMPQTAFRRTLGHHQFKVLPFG